MFNNNKKNISLKCDICRTKGTSIFTLSGEEIKKETLY